MGTCIYVKDIIHPWTKTHSIVKIHIIHLFEDTVSVHIIYKFYTIWYNISTRNMFYRNISQESSLSSTSSSEKLEINEVSTIGQWINYG